MRRPTRLPSQACARHCPLVVAQVTPRKTGASSGRGCRSGLGGFCTDSRSPTTSGHVRLLCPVPPHTCRNDSFPYMPQLHHAACKSHQFYALSSG